LAGFPWKDQRQQPVLRHRPSHKAFASKVQAVDGKARATHEVDGGLETVSLTLPAIITTDSRLNEPALRHAAQHHGRQEEAAGHLHGRPGRGGQAAPEDPEVMEPRKRSAGVTVPDVPNWWPN
jgi:electron transfer flavoprotein beta subunit